ncbi:MAG: CBS domain-containing protein [Comamonadaceae bacterium]|nr:CBS domain-containing protein [Comamonadaceae bacterium]
MTVAETATMDAALEHMKHNGVRCAFAIDDARRVVVGLVTAYDIMSEIPMRHMQSTASPRQEVLVRDIMQGIAEWRSCRRQGHRAGDRGGRVAPVRRDAADAHPGDGNQRRRRATPAGIAVWRQGQAFAAVRGAKRPSRL